MRSEDELFFFSESIQQAREKPLAQCLQYLRGMLEAMQQDHAAAKILRTIIAQLTSSDAQLELIQIGQIQMRLGVDSTSIYAPKPRKSGKKGTQ